MLPTLLSSDVTDPLPSSGNDGGDLDGDPMSELTEEAPLVLPFFAPDDDPGDPAGTEAVSDGLDDATFLASLLQDGSDLAGDPADDGAGETLATHTQATHIIATETLGGDAFAQDSFQLAIAAVGETSALDDQQSGVDGDEPGADGINIAPTETVDDSEHSEALGGDLDDELTMPMPGAQLEDDGGREGLGEDAGPLNLAELPPLDDDGEDAYDDAVDAEGALGLDLPDV